MADGYKEAKESFVSGMTGSSITLINLVSLVALVRLAAVSLYAAIRTRIAPTRRIGFLASWALLVLPMLLGMTVAATNPLYLLALLLLPLGFTLVRLPRVEAGTPLPSSVPASPSVSPSSSSYEYATQIRPTKTGSVGQRRIRPLPALTTYRAHMMLMTVLAILAVDFPVFPRPLAKCETFGVSLMDLGVGSFVFSQGIVSAIPLLKDPAYITAPLLPKVLRVTKKSLPVIALGGLRVVLVKMTGYPEHVTEYGVHWNFFITLALLPILQVLLHPVLLFLPISMVGVLVALLQQLALSHFHLKAYVLSDVRSSLVSANKEGLVSLPGYLAIQLLGLSAGTLILPPSPSFFRRRQAALLSTQKQKEKARKRRNSDPHPANDNDNDRDEDGGDTQAPDTDVSAPRQTGKTATELCGYAILWWALLGVVRVLRVGGRWDVYGGVSRRMVNLPYILWVAAFNVSFLLLYLVVLDMGLFADPDASRAKANLNANVKRQPKHQSTQTLAQPVPGPPFQRAGPGVEAGAGAEAVGGGSTGALGNPPRLLEAVNRHGLSVFLLANILTGLVNLSVSTMYASDVWALSILCGYSLALCGAAWVVDGRRSRSVGRSRSRRGA
ncbi:GWT1-domain-containing protein [Flammula alnicola]|nr:GWT1-domain-containing protein [Flammula alnicola]